MAKVFISGIAGFLGSHLADALIKEGHQVSGCDNLIGGYEENVPKEATFYKYDCGNLKLMSKVLKDIDLVYHCAATAYEGLSVFSPVLVTQNVFENSITMITASIINKVKRFVFCSSMARYGKNEVPFLESMQCKPEDPYGISKYAVELILKNLSAVHGLEYVIVAPHNIIGTRQKYDDPYRNVAAIMINLMLQGRQPIIYGDGEQKRCFSFVNDCVSPLVKLGFRDDVAGQIFNIGPDEEFVTINELAQTIAKLINFDLKPIYQPARPQEVELATCSADKARKILGYKTTYTLEQGLKEMVDWIKQKGIKKFNYSLPLEIINEKTPKSWKEKLF